MDLPALEALIDARKLPEAIALARSALTRPGLPRVARARLRIKLASTELMSGNLQDCVTEAEGVLVVQGLPEELYAAAELARLEALLTRDFSSARGPAIAILSGRSGPGADAALSGALMALSLIAWDEGKATDSVSLMRAAVHRADHVPPDMGHTRHPRFGLALILTALGECSATSRSSIASHAGTRRRFCVCTT